MLSGELSCPCDRSCFVQSTVAITIPIDGSDSIDLYQTGPGCSKLTTTLVNILLKFQKLISEMCQYLLLKKMKEAFALQKLLSFFQQKYQCIWL